jgi:hypothetical protein
MMAVKILNNIDMAPRTTLILAYPTGLALAWAKGWVQVPGYVPIVAALAFTGWLGLAWVLHLQHAKGGPVRRIDLAIRYFAVLAFSLGGLAGLTGLREMPLFIALKLCVMAGCVTLGLVVRRQLVPMFDAIREMTATGPTPRIDATIRRVNNRARVSVVSIWVLIVAAAFLGIAKPT